ITGPLDRETGPVSPFAVRRTEATNWRPPGHRSPVELIRNSKCPVLCVADVVPDAVHGRTPSRSPWTSDRKATSPALHPLTVSPDRAARNFLQDRIAHVHTSAVSGSDSRQLLDTPCPPRCAEYSACQSSCAQWRAG